jgi:hypothetical protein
MTKSTKFTVSEKGVPSKNYTWDEETKTFRCGCGLNVDFGKNSINVMCGCSCVITAGARSNIDCDDDCTILAGSLCDIKTGEGCTIRVGSECDIVHGEDCTIIASSYNSGKDRPQSLQVLDSGVVHVDSEGNIGQIIVDDMIDELYHKLKLKTVTELKLLFDSL